MQPMRGTLLLVLAFVLASCSPKVEPPTPKPEPQPPVAQPSSTSDNTPDPAPPKPAAQDPRHNDLRIYQLSELKVVDLALGSHKFKAWVMDTDSKRLEGMMHLQTKDVRDDEAMLFVFPEPVPKERFQFWMQNTPLPLDILYISTAFKVINIAHGKPFDETPLPADASGQFVVELKGGTAKRLGIGPGTVVKFPKEIIPKS